MEGTCGYWSGSLAYHLRDFISVITIKVIDIAITEYIF